ncbi:hypothetical protein DBR40_23745 [Pedobacter sp. KBW01]|nr:hypothetical protein DBR40_23745 [Pedobacter sp. KBW01]
MIRRLSDLFQHLRQFFKKFKQIISQLFENERAAIIGKCSPAIAYSPLPMKYRDAGYPALSGLQTMGCA